jgi:alanine dehydrogenase
LQDVGYFYSTATAIAKNCLDADLVIGAVLNKGAKAPYVVTEEMIKAMRKGTVVVEAGCNLLVGYF